MTAQHTSTRRTFKSWIDVWDWANGKQWSFDTQSDHQAYIVRAVNYFETAIKYLVIEHRQEKEGPHHHADCDLCEFIAKAEGK